MNPGGDYHFEGSRISLAGGCIQYGSERYDISYWYSGIPYLAWDDHWHSSWRPALIHSTRVGETLWYVRIPLWLPFLVVLSLTICLWWLDLPIRRKRRIRKWTALSLSTLFVLVWFLSLYYSVSYRRSDAGWGFTLEAGAVIVGTWMPDARQVAQVDRLMGWNMFDRGYDFTDRPLEWWVKREKGWMGEELLCLPLWLMFLTVLIPTIYFWWGDRRRIPPGCCKTCGYNLTGNVSGVCPECHEPKP